MKSEKVLQKFIRKQNTLLHPALELLYISGCNPICNRFPDKILILINISANSFIFCLSLYEISYNWQGMTTVSKCDSFFIHFQALSKIIFFLLNKKDLLDLLKQLPQFWSSDGFPTHTQLKNKNVHKSLKKIAVGFIVLSLPVMIFYFVKAYLDRSLVFHVYEYCSLASTSCFAINTTFQIVTQIWFVIPGIYGFDAVLVVLVGNVFCGYELLEEAVTKMDFTHLEHLKLSQINRIVDQHNVLLRFIKDMNRMYSNILLVQFWTTLTISTACLFLLTYDGFPPDLDHVFKYGLFLVNILVQAFIYCFAGSILREKTRKFADTVYKIKWYYDGQIQVRRSVVLMIQRANKKDGISIGGMRDLALSAFTSVVKNSVSIYTLMNSLRNSDR